MNRITWRIVVNGKTIATEKKFSFLSEAETYAKSMAEKGLILEDDEIEFKVFVESAL
jgi:hypothetical protein